jgi:hypothetical protein
MGKLIVFHNPANYKAPHQKQTPSPARGKVLAWRGAAAKKSA